MMLNYDMSIKKKIIIGGILTVIAIGVGIYGFVSMNSDDSIEIDENLDLNNIVQNEEIDEELENNDECLNKEDVEDEEILIHITGEVNKTGIISLKKGARIIDAIEAAGGAKKEADLDEVNLAYELEDGIKIYIPNKKEKQQNTEKVYITSESGNNVIVENVSRSGGVSKKVNINTATQSEFENLPGIGPEIASRIVEYREQNGKFSKIEDLQNVKGIGNAKFENIKNLIVVK